MPSHPSKIRKQKPRKVQPLKKKNLTGVQVMEPKDYAELRGVTLQLVCRALRTGKLKSKSLTGVQSYAKHSRFYLLTVDLQEATKDL